MRAILFLLLAYIANGSSLDILSSASSFSIGHGILESASTFARRFLEINLDTDWISNQTHPLDTLITPNIDKSRKSNCIVIRPFAAGDVEKLAASFERWEKFLPCKIDEFGNPTSANLPVDMILYFSQRIEDYPDHAKILEEIMEHEDTNWRKCFGTISVLDANLSMSQDRYDSNSVHVGVDWNLGPNMQFYRMAQYVSDYREEDIVYFMEHDSIPVVEFWFDDIINAVHKNQPFSVMGSTYLGHNWDNLNLTKMDICLKNHLNGNGVYNISHQLLQQVIYNFANDNLFEITAHLSFDVDLCETLIGEFGASIEDIKNDPFNYKNDDTFGNYAKTIFLPQDLREGTKIIHGAAYYHNWPTQHCNVNHQQNWYPKESVATQNDDSITLVVTDFGDGAIHKFISNLEKSKKFVQRRNLQQNDQCEGLPFSEIIVITQDEEIANQYSRLYPMIDVKARDWSMGDGYWDFCTANINSKWFMLVTAFFRTYENFKLAVDFDYSNGKMKPLIPFLHYDSIHCGRECRQNIEYARKVYDDANNHIDQQFATFNTQIRDKYCIFLHKRNRKTQNEKLKPTTDGYFAFIERELSTNLDDEIFDGIYELYKREKIFTVPGFRGQPLPAVACEDTADTSDCPCQFPFSFKGKWFHGCAEFGNIEGLRCPTSLTNKRAHRPESEDWKYCSESDLEVKGRRELNNLQGWLVPAEPDGSRPRRRLNETVETYSVYFQLTMENVTEDNFEIVSPYIIEGVSIETGVDEPDITVELQSSSSRRFLEEAIVEVTIATESILDAQNLIAEIVVAEIMLIVDEVLINASITNVSVTGVSEPEVVTTTVEWVSPFTWLLFTPNGSKSCSSECQALGLNCDNFIAANENLSLDEGMSMQISPLGGECLKFRGPFKGGYTPSYRASDGLCRKKDKPSGMHCTAVLNTLTDDTQKLCKCQSPTINHATRLRKICNNDDHWDGENWPSVFTMRVNILYDTFQPEGGRNFNLIRFVHRHVNNHEYAKWRKKKCCQKITTITWRVRWGK